MRMYRLLPLLALLFVAALCSACGKKLDSRVLDRQITIDGNDDEWRDARIYLDKIQASLGLFNDGDYLYLSIGLTDPTRQRQLLASGFTVWFDAKGAKGKTFGVRFPLGMRERMVSMQGMGGRRGRRGIGGMGGNQAGDGPDQIRRLFETTMQTPELEIIGPNPHQTRRLALEQAGAVQLGIALDKGRLVYEVRIPFIEIYARAGGRPDFDKVLGLGLETPELETVAMQGRGGGMIRRGPMGSGMGSGMGMRGPLGGGRGIGSFSRPEPLDLWTKVRLARL